MKKYYKERFEAQRRLAKSVAPLNEVNDILDKMREEARKLVPSSMEACILLLDPDAQKYTRPLQCALYDKPVNCLLCKRGRGAIQKALDKRKGVVVSKPDPVLRHDSSQVEVGPEAAIPVFANDEILAVVSVVSRPGTRFTSRDFFLIKDLSEAVGNAILNAKKHWEVTQEKIKIGQMLTHLSPFVPQSVRQIVENDPGMLKQEKEKKDVTVLFLDLEGYTRLSSHRSEIEVNEIVEKMFSSFVDPIHRSGGDINETAGDGLMIIFKNYNPKGNAINAIKAAFDVDRISQQMNRKINEGSKPINVNIGINSGSALVGLSQFKGSLDTRMTYTATGPVTNLAARLADHAKGGDILIGEETKQLVEGLWPLFDLGQVHIKGLDDPMRIYSLKGELHGTGM
ncbi:MAG: adenylate/guanylate cyclase domain-containing protein [Desulfobacteraceae bacterium]|jgi:class 3 adenylate cyclase/putative methionine-R-sulfoxide reductase with GAF domain